MPEQQSQSGQERTMSCSQQQWSGVSGLGFKARPVTKLVWEHECSVLLVDTVHLLAKNHLSKGSDDLCSREVKARVWFQRQEDTANFMLEAL
jgi:hypothetical protein